MAFGSTSMSEFTELGPFVHGELLARQGEESIPVLNPATCLLYTSDAADE